MVAESGEVANFTALAMVKNKRSTTPRPARPIRAPAPVSSLPCVERSGKDG